MTNPLTVRRATRADLVAIVALLHDDELHPRAEGTAEPLDPAYVEAFEAIARTADNGVFVADAGGVVLGTFQLTFIRQLSYRGCLVGQIESVVVHSSARSRGVGSAMMRYAIEEARRRGCLRVQLTSNQRRERAHRFYERLGFTATHAGMKLYLDEP